MCDSVADLSAVQSVHSLEKQIHWAF